MPATITFEAVAFRALLASKPGTGRFNFEDNRRCPIAQYLSTQTSHMVSCGSLTANVFARDDILTFDIPKGWTDAMAGGGLRKEWTWGQALERFDRLMAAA